MKLSGAGRGGWSRVYIAAVDRDGLAGDEVAFRGSEKNQRPEQVLRMLVALERARLDGALARGRNMTGIFAHHRVAQREAGRQRIDADAVLAELARERVGTRTSILPKRSIALDASPWTDLSSLTSASVLATELAPCRRAISSAKPVPSAISAIMIWAPSAASARA